MLTIDDLVKLLLRHLDVADYRLADVAEEFGVSSDEVDMLVAKAESHGRVTWWRERASCMLSESEAAKWGLKISSPDRPNKNPDPTYYLFWVKRKAESWLPKRLNRHRDSWHRYELTKDMDAVVPCSDGPLGDDPGWIDRNILHDASPGLRGIEVDDRAVDMLIEIFDYQYPDDLDGKLAKASLPKDVSRRLKKLKYNRDDYGPALLQLHESVTAHLIGTGRPGWTKAHEKLGDGMERMEMKCIVCGDEPLAATSCCLGCLQPDLHRLASPGLNDLEKNSEIPLRTSVKNGELPGLDSRGEVGSA